MENILSEYASMSKGVLLPYPKKMLSQTLRGKSYDLPPLNLMERNCVVEARHRTVYLIEWCVEECFAES